MLVLADAQTHRLHHLGRAGEIIPIILRNLLFSLITLGLYRFWAITNVRRYLWSRTFFHDDPVEYTGTGKELFLGFLVGAVVVLVPLLGLSMLGAMLQAAEQSTLASVVFGLYSLLVMGLTPIALYRARRYRLNRTVWRGIRWGQTGSSLLYAANWLLYGMLTTVTLGLAYPWQSLGLERYRLNHTHFGSMPLRFDGHGKALFGRWLVIWAVGAVTAVAVALLLGAAVKMANELGNSDPKAAAAAIGVATLMILLPGLLLILVPYCWYKAAELRYVAAHTEYQGVRFRCDVTAWQLMRLAIGNMLLRLLTLGLGAPYALVRTARLMARTLSAEGDVDFDRVRQNADPRSRTGEGLAAALNVGEF